MHPLFHFLKRWKCKNVFHSLALDAISQIEGEEAEAWQGLFLWRIEPFLRGVDAPAQEFRDFANHSFDADEPWGTASRLASKWFEMTTETIRSGDWNAGAHHAGVLLRYATFTLLLFHGRHHDPGLSLRHFLAWYLGENYGSLTDPRDEEDLTETVDFRQFEQGRELEEFLAGASRLARADEAVVLDWLTPIALDSGGHPGGEEREGELARHLQRVRMALGVVMRRVIADADKPPPSDPLGVASVVAWPSLPVFWATRAASRLVSQKDINAMRRGWSEAGAVGSLPDLRSMADVEALREAYAIAHARSTEADEGDMLVSFASDIVPLSIARAVPGELQTFEPITGDSSLREATSMGEKLANDLADLRVCSVRDFVAANPSDLAALLSNRVTAGDIADWQNEAALCHDIPLLSPTEAQLLVACGVTGRADLATFSPVDLWELVIPVAESPDGIRILGKVPSPGLDCVSEWIDAARLEAA